MTKNDKEKSKIAIDKALAQLKDFQKATVDYAYKQLYKKNRNKILVADEVGLGKTIVAKGIIAKGYKKYLDDGYPNKDNPTYNVVYICSNLAIAKQNISKLNIFNYWGNKDNPDNFVDPTINRLIYLSYKPREKPTPFLINSLTPGTSFDEKSHFGESTERLILLDLLTYYKVFHDRENGLKWLLKGGVKKMSTWNKYIKEHRTSVNTIIRKDLFGKFREALLKEKIDIDTYPNTFYDLNLSTNISLWEAVKRLSDRINNSNKHTFKSKSEAVRALRRILSRLCLEYLGADIFILDEFQRYSNLIKFDQEAENPAIEMARAVFEIEDAKVLMLSATPFKPYTNDFDELNGEVHYKEFEAVLRFLMSKDPNILWDQFNLNRKAFFNILRNFAENSPEPETALTIKKNLEMLYRKSLVRTERLLVSKEHDAMIKSVIKDQPLEIIREDIEEFQHVDKLVEYLNEHYNAKLPIPLEYVKSSPFVLSYLDNYQHKKKLTKFARTDGELQNLIIKSKKSWLDIDSINSYMTIGIDGGENLPNSKLRLLLKESLYENGWKYLWVPPTVEYYQPCGAYKNSKGYSKCLIFSSWVLVPKMIATLSSYESERLTIGNPRSITGRVRSETERKYFAEKRTPAPLIRFRTASRSQEPEGMANFIILYPSLFLRNIYDPATSTNKKLNIQELRSKVKELLRQPLRKIIKKYGKGDSDWQKWMWVAPLLLDKESRNKNLIMDWFSEGIPRKHLAVDIEDSSTERDEQSGKEIQFDFAKKVFEEPAMLNLPTIDDERIELLLDFLVSLSLGGASICSLRSLDRYSNSSSDSISNLEILNAAFNISSAFVTIFNKPESISIIRLTTKKGDYIDQVLEYSIDGNIQSMLDEYIYLLIDCDNLKTTNELSDNICDTLSIRTNRRQIDDLKTFINNLNRKKIEKKSIRTHFAADFTDPRSKTAASSDRTINIRQAFNSPFRPFILASTSIGQEGLDFHLYCKKVFHWNLPHNAIDLEQREGRIHRYKGLVIRQNLVEKYLRDVKITSSTPLWEKIFHTAEREKNLSEPKCELSPYWHTESINDNKLERFVPLYPFSRDIEKYKEILKVLTYYRLTFGQPRQEELIDALYKGKISESDESVIKELMINLSPLMFN